jgi:protein-L-isoaspartate(D-aspartate) O-methyltransferase
MSVDFAAARLNMLDSQVRTNDVPDLMIQDAMAAAPRERFCPSGREYLAYADTQIEYAPGWCLLKPRDIAKLLQALAPRPGERALCIAAPYGAMVLATMGLDVTLRLPAGAARQRADTALQGYAIQTDAGELLVPPNQGYDLVLIEGAVAEMPVAWLEALKKSGRAGARLGVILRSGPVGKAQVFIRSDDGVIGHREVFDATPSWLPGCEPVSSFAF